MSTRRGRPILPDFPPRLSRNHRRDGRGRHDGGAGPRRAGAGGSAGTRPARSGGSRVQDPRDGERRRSAGGRRRSLDACGTAARSPRVDRHQDRLRPRRVRRVHGADGRQAGDSCSQLAAWADGPRSRRSGVARRRLDALQRAFVEHDGPQCGFCVGAADERARPPPVNATPTEDDEPWSAICRCGNTAATSGDGRRSLRPRLSRSRHHRYCTPSVIHRDRRPERVTNRQPPAT